MPADISGAAAYGGSGWSPRTTTLREEIGTIWGPCGIASEWSTLQTVLLHRPGPELQAVAEPGASLMLDRPDAITAGVEHDRLAQAYRDAGVEVLYVEPASTPPPNQMFVGDLMFMTPEGTILARPASSVRAGEERWAARRLAQCGIPIVRCVRGSGTFEGADAAWLDERTVLIGRGLRTNAEGARQVAAILGEMGVASIEVDLPFGTMHLMGQVRIVDRNLAIAWRTRLAVAAVEALRVRGYEVLFVPDEGEAIKGFAFNFVTLGPRKILMPSGCPKSQAFYEASGITCHVVDIRDLHKAAGSIGCLTGIIRRAR